MKVISGLGGSGTTFILHSLERRTSRTLFGMVDPDTLKRHLPLSPTLLRRLKYALTATHLRVSDFRILRRPDRFWTDWNANPSGQYAPGNPDFAEQVSAQRDYILKTVRSRSAGLPIRRDDLSTASLTDLVASYVKTVETIERDIQKNVVLLCCHWGEFGILRDLGVETIYLIRDPFNSIVSHSKSIRHEKDYLKRGLETINTKEWVDNYLVGPHHHWVDHAKHALNHGNARIIRYQHFPADWRSIDGLPDIAADFQYKENDIAELLEPAIIEYIYDRTREICEALGFDEIYHQIVGA